MVPIADGRVKQHVQFGTVRQFPVFRGYAAGDVVQLLAG